MKYLKTKRIKRFRKKLIPTIHFFRISRFRSIIEFLSQVESNNPLPQVITVDAKSKMMNFGFQDK